MKAYPIQEVGGLVWTYIGPAPVPALPRWDLLFRDDGRKYAWGFVEHCNWLQSYENACDMTHLNWLHASVYPSYAARQPEIIWERFEYGLTYTMPLKGIVGDVAVDTVGGKVFLSNKSHNRLEVWSDSTKLFSQTGIAVGSERIPNVDHGEHASRERDIRAGQAAGVRRVGAGVDVIDVRA